MSSPRCGPPDHLPSPQASVNRSGPAADAERLARKNPLVWRYSLTRRGSVRLPDPAANDDRPAPIRDTSGPSLVRCRLVPGGGPRRTAWLRIPRSAQLVSVEAVTAWPVLRMGRARPGSGGRIPLRRILRRPHRQLVWPSRGERRRRRTRRATRLEWIGSRSSAQLVPGISRPVSTKPSLSRLRAGASQSVWGLAPIMMNTAAAGTSSC